MHPGTLKNVVSHCRALGYGQGEPLTPSRRSPSLDFHIIHLAKGMPHEGARIHRNLHQVQTISRQAEIDGGYIVDYKWPTLCRSKLMAVTIQGKESTTVGAESPVNMNHRPL